MKRRKRLPDSEYDIGLIYWSGLSFLLYKSLLFRCLNGYSYTESMYILLGLVGCSLTIGAVLGRKGFKYPPVLFQSVVTPYEIYSFFAYAKTAAVLFRATIIVSAVLCAFYAVIVTIRSGRKRRSNTAVKRFDPRRLIRALFESGKILRCTAFACLLLLCAFAFFGSSVFSPSVEAKLRNYDYETAIYNSIDTLLLLREPVWAGLSTAGKLNVLQTVANIEAVYLGLPHELNVTTKALEEDVLACYDERTHGIVLNIDHLERDAAHDVLDSVCHEARHAYQHCLCELFSSVSADQQELFLFDDARRFTQEFANYSDDNDLDYYYMSCEMDSREFAKKQVLLYYECIDRYLAYEADDPVPLSAG